MIAANDTDTSFLTEMAPDQLRAVVAVAGGLLAHQCGVRQSTGALRRVARALERQYQPTPNIYCEKSTLSREALRVVLEQVERDTDVTPRQVLSRDRRRPAAHARQYAMWLLRQHTDRRGLPKYSYPEIGRAFGRDHSTVMSSVQAYAERERVI